MFDFGIGSSELMFIAIVALIVVGPKDLPKLLRTLGKYVSKIKSMAREFQGHIEDAAKETGVSDLKDELGKATEFDFDDEFKNYEEDIAKVFEDSTLDPSDEPEIAKKPARKKAAKKPAKKAAKKPAKKAAKKPAAKNSAKKKTAAKKPAGKPAKKATS